MSRMSASIEGCEVCEARPVCRVVDLGDRIIRVCAACATVFRSEPEVLLAAVIAAYEDEEERR